MVKMVPFSFLKVKLCHRHDLTLKVCVLFTLSPQIYRKTLGPFCIKTALINHCDMLI